jgi:hypothetical protein
MLSAESMPGFLFGEGYVKKVASGELRVKDAMQ